MFIDYYQFKRCLQWYTYCMMWTPSVHLYSHLQLMRYFPFFLTLSLFQRKRLWLTMLYILSKVTSSEIMALSLTPSYFDSKIYVLFCLHRLSFFGNICISDLYEVTEVLLIKFALHTELQVSTNVTNDRIHIWRRKPSWMRSWT